MNGGHPLEDPGDTSGQWLVGSKDRPIAPAGECVAERQRQCGTRSTTRGSPTRHHTAGMRVSQNRNTHTDCWMRRIKRPDERMACVLGQTSTTGRDEALGLEVRTREILGCEVTPRYTAPSHSFAVLACAERSG